MKVCSNCGARIYIDSQNCTICGAPLIGAAQQNQQEQQNRQIQNDAPNQSVQRNRQVQNNEPTQPERQNQQVQNNQPNQRRTVYEGEIHKCPICGENLPSFAAECPACGHEIRGTASTISITEFSLKLGQLQSDEEKSDYIRYFPIPNSKEDIFEFLILASTNVHEGSLATTVSEAWMIKVEQCYQKAKLSFSNSDDLSKIRQTYDDFKSLLEEAKNKEKHKKIFHLIIRNLAAIIGIIFMLVAVLVDLFNGPSWIFELLCYMAVIGSAIALFRQNSLLSDIGIGALSGVLTIALSFLLDISGWGILCGFIVIILVAVNFFICLSRKSGDSNQAPSTRTNVTNTNRSNSTPTNTVSNSSNTNLVPPPSRQTLDSQTSTTVPTPIVTPSGVPTPITPTANVLPSAVPIPTASTPNPSNIILNVNVPSNPVVQSSSPPPTRTQPVCSVKIPRPVKNGSERNYAAVEALLVQAGFTNVKTVPLNDLFLGIMTTPGEIEKITVDGKDLGSYFRRTFDSDVPVLITYHSRRI